MRKNDQAAKTATKVRKKSTAAKSGAAKRSDSKAAKSVTKSSPRARVPKPRTPSKPRTALRRINVPSDDQPIIVKHHPEVPEGLPRKYFLKSTFNTHDIMHAPVEKTLRMLDKILAGERLFTM